MYDFFAGGPFYPHTGIKKDRRITRRSAVVIYYKQNILFFMLSQIVRPDGAKRRTDH